MRVTSHTHLIIATIILALAFTCYGASVSEPNKPSAEKASPREVSAHAQKDSDAIRAAKAELSRDYYKDCVDNLKWALGIIIGLVIIFIGYATFKSTREYRQALADVKEALSQARQATKEARDASDRAREYEEKAQGRLVSIDREVAAKLKEIEVRGQELITSLIQESEEQRKAGREEAEKQLKVSREQAERQRKISKLFNKAWKADEAKDYEAAADCYRQIVEELKEENDSVVYNNWGAALSDLAESKKGKEAEKFFKQAIEKYKKAIDIKLDDSEVYDNWGGALLCLAKLKGGKDAEDILKQTEEKCLKAESIKTGEGAYNLACVYARRGNEDKCREWLKVGEKAGILDTREHAMANDDFKSVREKDWFKKLRWKGK